MPVTYSSGRITVTGYTESSPCTFDIIYNADVAGGWGVVTRQCTNQFCITTYLDIGDGPTTTWFADTKKSVFFTEFGAYWTNCIEIKNNANFRLGTLNDDALKSTRDGCVVGHASTLNPKRFIKASNGGADIKIYSCCLFNSGSQRGSAIDGETIAPMPNLQIYNTQINNMALNAMNLNLHNVTITGNKSTFGSFGLMRTDGISNKINVIDTYTSLYWNLNRTFKNVVIRDMIRMYGADGATVEIINGDIDNWFFNWNSTANSACYRVYEFDLKLLDESSSIVSGAKTVVWDLNDNEVLNTETNVDGIVGADHGQATAGSLTTLTDTNKSWSTDEWISCEVLITSGTGSGQRRVILSNTPTVLTIAGWDTTPDTTSNYVILSNTLAYGKYTRTSNTTTTLSMETPHTLKIYSYGKNITKTKFESSAKTEWILTLYDDDYITQTNKATVAAYTGISINHTSGMVTISSNHTLDEIYDYLQYDIGGNPQLDIDEIINTTDGINYVSVYDFTINSGTTVTCDDQRLTMLGTRSYTLNGDFTGIIADQTKSRVFIKLIVKDAVTKSLLQNARVYIKTDPGGTELMNTLTDSNGQAGVAYEHTSDINIIGVARLSTVSPLYKSSDIAGLVTLNGYMGNVLLVRDD